MEKQQESLKRIGEEYSLKLEEHQEDLQIKKQFNEIQKICRNYGIEVNPPIYAKGMDRTRMSYGNRLNKHSGIGEDDYIRMILNRCVCPAFTLLGDEQFYRYDVFSKGEVPEWVKEGICFVYSSTIKKIKAHYSGDHKFEEKMWERLNNRENFGALLSPVILKQYELKKTFHPKEADNFLMDQLIKSFREIAQELNKKNDYDGLTQELVETIKETYSKTN